MTFFLLVGGSALVAAAGGVVTYVASGHQLLGVAAGRSAAGFWCSASGKDACRGSSSDHGSPQIEAHGQNRLAHRERDGHASQTLAGHDQRQPEKQWK